MLTFKTSSGSLYEVDQENKLIRRKTGVRNPTARQGVDGEWKKYSEMTPIVIGHIVYIIWSAITPAGTIPATQTGLVISVDKEPVVLN